MARPLKLSAASVAEMLRLPTTYRSPAFTCRAQVGSGAFQLAVLAPKKTWPNAADRNRVRRRVREAYAAAAKPGQVGRVLVTSLKAAEKAPFADLVAAAAASLPLYNPAHV